LLVMFLSFLNTYSFHLVTIVCIISVQVIIPFILAFCRTTNLKGTEV
jgi:hypothetical protein